MIAATIFSRLFGSTSKTFPAFNFYIPFCWLFSFLMFISTTKAAGQLDFQIRELILTKAPPRNCMKGVDCPSPSSSTKFSDHHNIFPLNFRLCIGTHQQQRKDCLILARNFTLNVKNVPTFLSSNITNRPFMALEFPLQQFNFTSTTIDSLDISIDLSVFSGDGEKLLLYSRQTISSLDVQHAEPITFKYEMYGNSIAYQFNASCSPGFVGPRCAILCESPLPSDNYICTPNGLQCLPGWDGARCMQPICSEPCTNGGRCVAPDKCACPTGWEGQRCEKCRPKMGCQNGYCLDRPGKCFCLPNWTGPNCDLLVNKCLEKPCKNGGKCTTLGQHGNYFRCFCMPGFTGVDCSISYSACRNASCGPNQHCAPLENDNYSCICDFGFEGSNCRKKPSESGKHWQQEPDPTQKTPAPSSFHFGNEFGIVKTLIGACFFLLLLIVAILCCNHHGIITSPGIPTRICPRPLRDRTTTPEFGERKEEEEKDDEQKQRMTTKKGKSSTFIRMHPSGTVHWGSTSSNTATNDDDELDSGMGSIHSNHRSPFSSSLGQNTANNGTGQQQQEMTQQQQQRRLLHQQSSHGAGMTATSSVMTSAISPPPSYEESLRASPINGRRVVAAFQEAFV